MRLHGLDAESRQVNETLTAAQHGAGSILLVEGFVGDGKSTLLTNAALTALERGFRVASSVDRPALSFANRPLTELPSSFHTLPVLGDEAGLPQLRGWLIAQQEAWRHGHGTPLLITLDDLHELPAVNVKALATLPTWCAHNPVVWLLARRIGAARAEVHRLFSPVDNQVARIRMEPMTATDTVALVRDVARAEPAPELLVLTELAGGNRLLVVELVRGLIEEHGPSVVQDGTRLAETRLPQRLRNAVDLLLYAVSSRCRDMLRVVALCGGQLPLPRIAALLQEPIGALLSLISEAVDVGVLAGEVNDLMFVHELTRRTLASEIPSAVAQQVAEEILSGNRSNYLTGVAKSEEYKNEGDTAVVPSLRRAAPENGRRDRRRQHLTDTQRTIAQLVGTGLTNQQIADQLCLSPHTVNYHLRRIYRRLAIHTRAELAALEARSEVGR